MSNDSYIFCIIVLINNIETRIYFQITFTMHLDMSAVLVNHTKIEFKAVATTLSKNDFKDNETSFLINSAVAADIGIAGYVIWNFRRKAMDLCSV